MDKRKRAIDIAQHYFGLIANRAGVNWCGENHNEIADLINLIIDAAKDELREETAIREDLLRKE